MFYRCETQTGKIHCLINFCLELGILFVRQQTCHILRHYGCTLCPFKRPKIYTITPILL